VSVGLSRSIAGERGTKFGYFVREEVCKAVSKRYVCERERYE